MPDFRAKMHQKSISVGALPQTPLGSLQRSYRFGGPTSKGRGRKGKGEEGKKGEGRGNKGRGGNGRKREGGRKGKGEDNCYSKLFRPWSAKAITVPHQIIEVGTLAVDGWAGTFGTARRGLGEAAVRPVPSSLYRM